MCAPAFPCAGLHVAAVRGNGGRRCGRRCGVKPATFAFTLFPKNGHLNVLRTAKAVFYHVHFDVKQSI